MKIFMYLSAASLLGACASATSPPATPSGPPPGTATYNTTGATDYTVIHGGVTHALLASDPRSIVNDGVTVWNWTGAGGGVKGYGRSTNIGTAVAAGYDGSTYFAGISGPLSSRIASSGTASYTGGYGFVVNGVDSHGPLALTADFAAGTLTDTTAGIDVNGSITGGSRINGTVTIGGEIGTLTGGFYAHVTVAGAVVGANMAGIIVAN